VAECIDEVPVISLGKTVGDDARRMIDYASREWGFYQVIDHGIDHSVIAQMQKQKQMHCLFSLNAD
jgi:isopenicillin N synthase-like dioxygenase